MLLINIETKAFRKRYERLLRKEMNYMNTPVADAKAVNELLARYGVKFGIYKNGTSN